MRGDYKFDAKTLELGQAFPGEHKVGSDGAGQYSCLGCGATWLARDRKQWWPVRMFWSSRMAYGRHFVEVGADGIEQRVLQQCFSLGPLRIILGGKGR